MEWTEFKQRSLEHIKMKYEGDDDPDALDYFTRELVRFEKCTGFRDFFKAAAESSWDLPSALRFFFITMYPEEGFTGNEFYGFDT